jgi:hypothetical protein
MYENYKYVGYKTKVATTTKIVDIDSIVVDGVGEHYQSIYRFNEEILDRPSLAGLRKETTFFADYLVFDIDDKNLDNAYSSMQRLREYLDFREVGYETWFSGSKGFHINIPTSQFNFVPTDDATILSKMALAIAEKVNVTVDPTIYNVTRIFRMPGSLNIKSGLYKVPIEDATETLKEILIRAKSSAFEDNHPEPDDYGVNDTLMALYEGVQNLVKVNRTVQPTQVEHGRSLFSIPKEGERNDACYKLARHLAKRAVKEADAVQIILWWSSDMEKPMGERELRKTVASAFEKGVNEMVDEETFGKQFYDVDKSLKSVQRVVSNLNNTIIKTGFDFIDNYTMGLWRQDVVFILARSGNFKTCFASALMKNIAKTTGKKTLLFSMEMNPDRLNMRHMQDAEGFNQLEVIEKVKEGHSFAKYKEDYKNVEVIGLSALTIESVLGMIDWYLQEKGDIGAICFDYLSLFRGCANNTEKTAQVATELKTRVAKAANCVVFCLVQAKRSYEGVQGNIEIDKQSGKDSSSIEDSGDYLLGLWNNKDKDGKKVHYGRFLKSRAFNSAKYDEAPYFTTDFDKPSMKLNSIELVPYSKLPKFKQLPKAGGYD